MYRHLLCLVPEAGLAALPEPEAWPSGMPLGQSSMDMPPVSAVSF